MYGTIIVIKMYSLETAKLYLYCTLLTKVLVGHRKQEV